MTKTEDDLVCLGVVTGARGLKGDLRIKSFTGTPEDIAAYGPLSDGAGERVFDLRITGQAKGVLIGRIDGIADRTAAEDLKGQRLYLAREKLPPPDEDEYYHSDLIGLRAEGAAGDLGTIKRVYDFGAGDVLEIVGGPYGSFMIPFTRATVPVVDVPGGRVVVDLPDGLLDDPEDETPEDDTKAT